MKFFSIFLLCMSMTLISSFSFAEVDDTKQEKITQLKNQIIILQKEREAIDRKIDALDKEGLKKNISYAQVKEQTAPFYKERSEINTKINTCEVGLRELGEHPTGDFEKYFIFVKPEK